MSGPDTWDELGENQCPDCGKDFETEAGLDLHRLRKHGYGLP